METRTGTLKARGRAHKRALLWSLLLVLAGAILLPAAGYVISAVMPAAQAQWQSGHNPRAAYWGDIRRGVVGTTEVRDPGANVLIQGGGQNWRQLRNGVVASVTPWFMAVMVVLIGLFHLVIGPSRLEQTPSGERVQRWSLYERTMHWYTAILFILMAISGLSILFGRAVLIPVFGAGGFAAYAWVIKYMHNFLGPLFTAGVLLMVLSWIRWNLPKSEDWQWIVATIKRKPHAPAGRMNAGEKMWFWFIAIFGLAVCVTGLIMDFPNAGFTRQTMQVANLIHGFVAVAWISVVFGHAYLGTIGVEGGWEGMIQGDVSVEWARQHHNVWYEQITHAEQQTPATSQQPDSEAKGGA